MVLRIKVSTLLAIRSSPRVEMRLGNVYTGNMSANANSVNIKTTKRAYHHGDLRSALVEAGLELLRSRSADELSLREIARAVGVSATAVYRHFPDKASLLAALASEGFERLAHQQIAAGAGGGGAGFAKSGQAYVRFALDNPSLFRLMFAHTPAEAHPDWDSPEGTAANLLRRGVAGMLPPDASRAEQFAGMLRAWSLVHGLAMLILDRQVDRPVAEHMIERVIGADSINLA
jgi:AcrR family transcriptional regulator